MWEFRTRKNFSFCKQFPGNLRLSDLKLIAISRRNIIVEKNSRKLWIIKLLDKWCLVYDKESHAKIHLFSNT